MNAIAIPVPLDSWETFRPGIQRWCDTYRQFPPGAPVTVYAMCCKSDPHSEVKEMFRDIPVEFARYDSTGCDIGAHQHCALEIGDAFLVGMSSRSYFWKEGWLAKMVESRSYFGPGLYATAVSRETGILHFRTYCYGMDTRFWREYPYLVNSRNQTFAFEHGAFAHPVGSLLNWAQQRKDMAAVIVYWDGGWQENDWFSRPNIFRSGDQSNLLTLDRHCLIYAEMSPADQEHWRRRAFFEGLPSPPEPPKATKCCGQK